MVSVPASSRSRLSAESSSMVGLIFFFPASGSNIVSKMVGRSSDDVVGRFSNAKMRSRDTYYPQCHYSKSMDRKLPTLNNNLVYANGGIYFSINHNGSIPIAWSSNLKELGK